MMLSSIMAHPAVGGEGRGWCRYTMGSLHRVPSLPNNAENPRSRLLFFKKFIFGCARCSLLHGLFSSCSKGMPSSCGAQASHFSSFSWSMGSGHGLSSFSSLAVESRLSSCGTGA